jgi:hypothetical protein
MNYIFLSTDGVLTNQNYINLISNRGQGYIHNHQNQIDKSKIYYLNYLVNKTSSKVVLTGQWRLLYTLDRLNDMLQKSGAKFEAVDQTPYIYKFLDGRKSFPHDEIEKCIINLRKRGNEVDEFLILDSYNDYGPYNSNFIKINYERGLRHLDVEKCLDYFKINYKKY